MNVYPHTLFIYIFFFTVVSKVLTPRGLLYIDLNSFVNFQFRWWWVLLSPLNACKKNSSMSGNTFTLKGGWPCLMTHSCLESRAVIWFLFPPISPVLLPNPVALSCHFSLIWYWNIRQDGWWYQCVLTLLAFFLTRAVLKGLTCVWFLCTFFFCACVWISSVHLT